MLKGRYVSLSVIACMAVALIAAPAAVQAASATLGLSSEAGDLIRGGSVTVDVKLTDLDPACPAEGELGDRVTLAQLFLSYSSACPVTVEVAEGSKLPQILFQEIADGNIKLLLAVSSFDPGAKEGACPGDTLATITLTFPGAPDCCNGAVGVELLAGDAGSDAVTTLYTTSNAQILPGLGAAWASYYDPSIPDLSGLDGLTEELVADEECGAVITTDYCALVTASCGESFSCEQNPPADPEAKVNRDELTQIEVKVTETGSGYEHPTVYIPVTWTDTIAPVIGDPANPVEPINAEESCSITVPDVKTRLGLSATDNCTAADDLVWDQEPDAGTTWSSVESPLVVTVTVEDADGNLSAESHFTFTFTNLKGSAISVTAPADVVAAANSACKKALPDYRSQATVSGGCGTITKTQSPAPGTLLAIGEHIITITATDPFGGSGYDTMKVTVKDLTAPAIQCPPTMEFEVQDDCGSFVIQDWRNLVQKSDSCSGIAEITQSPAPLTVIWLPSDIPTFTQWITFTVKDGAGNTSMCSTTIRIFDATAPSLTVDTAKEAEPIEVGEGCKGIMPDLFAEGYVTVARACEAGDTVQQSIDPGDLLAIGSHPVQFTYCDRYGARPAYAADHCVTVELTLTVVDTTPPTITQCPANMTGSTNEAGMTFDEPEAGYTDFCAATATYTLVDSGAPVTWGPGGTEFPVGVATSVRYSVVDASGNEASCTFLVDVKAYKTLEVTVEMQQGFTADTVTRCLKFTMVNDQDCDNPHVFTRLMTFTGGKAHDDTIEFSAEVSAKDWTHLIVVDELHSLSRVLPLTVESSSAYSASFTADNPAGNKSLRLGDVKDDGFIDILDFAMIVERVGSNLPKNTDCNTPAPHVDLGGDGTVTILQLSPMGDATFLIAEWVDGTAVNFLQKDETVAGCSPSPAPGSPKARSTAGPRSRVTVAELKKMGISGKADVDGDGDVDTMDVYKLVNP